TRFKCDWSSDVCSSDLEKGNRSHGGEGAGVGVFQKGTPGNPGVTVKAIIPPNCNSSRLAANSNSHEKLRHYLYRGRADRSCDGHRSEARGHAAAGEIGRAHV